jgi:hypothetical protein
MIRHGLNPFQKNVLQYSFAKTLFGMLAQKMHSARFFVIVESRSESLVETIAEIHSPSFLFMIKYLHFEMQMARSTTFASLAL